MSSRSGGLLELVARGKKDVFFTSNPKTSFFHSVYKRAAPFSKEIYITKPRNIPDWGHWTEFELEHRGDLARAFYLRLELPTWLPGPAVDANMTGIVNDPSGITFGYCNNVGFQIIDRVQVFQDTVLLHEFYGEYLDWRLRQSYSMVTAFTLAQDIGARPDTALAIGRSATPGLLRVPLPILGWQHLYDPGFPLVCVRNMRFRIRVLFRKLSDVVVASDGRLRPSPWGGKPLCIQRTAGGPIDKSQVSLPLTAMKSLIASLESTQVYLPADVTMALKAQRHDIPFLSVQAQQTTIEDNMLTAAATPGFATFSMPIPVEFIGNVDRLLIGFRSEAATLAGQRSSLTPAARTVRLNIANIDRIKQWPMSVYREVNAYWKNARLGLEYSGAAQEVYTITFGGFDYEVPAGTLSFTRAVLPTLYLTLNSLPFDTRNISRKTFALVYAESWNVFSAENGKGRMLFDDS